MSFPIAAAAGACRSQLVDNGRTLKRTLFDPRLDPSQWIGRDPRSDRRSRPTEDGARDQNATVALMPGLLRH